MKAVRPGNGVSLPVVHGPGCAQGGADGGEALILVARSGQLVRTLVAHDLVGEYLILTYEPDRTGPAAAGSLEQA
jgi:hypothetical protein